VNDVGITGKDILKVDVADAEEALVFEALALGVVRQGLVDGSPMLKDIAYCCHSLFSLLGLMGDAHAAI